jgi:predicted nucleic acid-binding protein
MFALDTNILVYAHNLDSSHYQKAKSFLESIMARVNGTEKTAIQTFLSLLETTTTRKKVFDVALAATLKDNGVEGLYTVNVDDFKDFPFL